MRTERARRFCMCDCARVETRDMACFCEANLWGIRSPSFGHHLVQLGALEVAFLARREKPAFLGRFSYRRRQSTAQCGLLL